MQSFWKKCSSCKEEIPHSTNYYVCNVSTCNQKRTGYVFCSMPCFDRHLPGARHKDAYAIEERSPKAGAMSSESTQSSPPKPITASAAPAGQRRIVTRKPSESTSTASSSPSSNVPRDILIVASKLKDYIRARSEYNTSADVMMALSDKVRLECERAIDNARADGRKTVMARDFK